MSDLIDRQDALSCFRDWIDQRGDVHTADEMPEYQRIEGLPSAQPDNQINLCDSCDYSYPDCPSQNDDVIFGNSIGNDNICACNKYKPSAQPKRTGHWINGHWDGDSSFRIDGRGNCWYVRECSNCHEEIEGNPTKYCPNCGAKMRGE